MIDYTTIPAALSGMRRHLDAANRLIIEGGALPAPRVRRMIDEHLDEYHRAAIAFAQLSAKGAREAHQHSLRAPLETVPDPTGRKPPLGRPVE